MPAGLHFDDTIAALASAAGHGARGIIRVSGVRTRAAVEAIFAPRDRGSLMFAQTGAWRYPGELRIISLRVPLPANVYFWPNHRSYTGQPLAELHTISSPPVLEAVLSDLFAVGARPAEPGEFTLRAFLAGRIDLTQAEAVLGVIDAQTDLELRAALDQLSGGLSSSIVRLRGDLLDLLADLEAGLDFADEAIEFVSHRALVGRLGLARDGIGSLLERAAGRMRPAPRSRVVLAGLPNAGKSTLFNRLVGSNAAIVSDVAGTTRDYLAAEVNFEGLAATLIDTAGHDETAKGISHEAQKQSRRQTDEADLVLWCRAADQPAESLQHARLPDANERILPVTTKCDLVQAAGADHHTQPVSAHSGAGLKELASAIAARLSRPAAGARQLVGTTAARCRDSLIEAQAALDRALAIARHERDQELLAIEVRQALDELGKIAGAVYTDDILDRIFSRFCIGK
jgi:tRNA modification GTPase